MARAFSLSASHGYYEADMAPAAFFGGQPNGTHAYYSGEVDRDLPASMLAELRPLEAALIARDPTRASVNLWLGKAPVAAPCHYDGYHNAYAQLHGAKRFILAPPGAWPLLRAFPFLHPSHAQCQEALRLAGTACTAAEASWTASLAAAGAGTVVLRRGDVLYLPPMWFHETLALAESDARTESAGTNPESDAHSERGTAESGGGAQAAASAAISVNGWVEGDEGAAAAELFALERPPLMRGDAARAEATAALVAALSAAAVGNGSLLVERVWHERYEALVASGRLPAQMSGEVECARLSAWRTTLEARPATRTWLRAAARLAAERLSDETRTTWLANLAELVAAERLGLPAVGAFWRASARCISAQL